VLNTEQLIEDFLLKKVTGIKTGWVSLFNITTPKVTSLIGLFHLPMLLVSDLITKIWTTT